MAHREREIERGGREREVGEERERERGGGGADRERIWGRER